MDFTREPIIETIITPKEGYKLVVRSSKSTGQEEYFVDAVELASFGHALFFRSLEKPKAFLVPVSDYEVLEVREARMVLKNAVLDRSIKIGGGREGSSKISREVEREEIVSEVPSELEEVIQGVAPIAAEIPPEVRLDKKRDRRRHYRKRKGREEEVREELSGPMMPGLENGALAHPSSDPAMESVQEGGVPLSTSLLSSLLQPPPALISETIARYRQNDLFRGAFYLKEEEEYKPHDKVQELLDDEEDNGLTPSLLEPTFAPEGWPGDSTAQASAPSEPSPVEPAFFESEEEQKEGHQDDYQG